MVMKAIVTAALLCLQMIRIIHRKSTGWLSGTPIRWFTRAAVVWVAGVVYICAQDNTTPVHVEVVEAGKGQPLDGVRVEVLGDLRPNLRSYTVNDQGVLDLKLQAPDTYTFTAHREGYTQQGQARAEVQLSKTPVFTSPRPIRMEGPPPPKKENPKKKNTPGAPPKVPTAERPLILRIYLTALQQPSAPPAQPPSCDPPQSKVVFDPPQRGVARVQAYRSILSGNDYELLADTFTYGDGDFRLDVPPDKSGGKLTLTITRPGYVPIIEQHTLCEIAGAGPYRLQRRQPETSSNPVQVLEGARRTSFLPNVMEELPLAGFRDFDRLALLAPGVARAPQSGRASGPEVAPTVGTPGQVAVNGLSGRQNNYTVDGSDDNDEMLGVRRQGFVNTSPQPLESIQEFQVLTAAGDTEFGRGIAGQINVQTRSGGFEQHGQAFGFLTDNGWNARDFFYQNIARGGVGPPITRQSDGATVLLNGSPIPTRTPAEGNGPYSRSDVGISAGGALRPLGLFYYGAYERRNSNGYGEYNFAVPTVGQRAIGGPTGGSGDTGIGAGFFPASLPGNAIFSLYPLPNNPAGVYGPNSYTAQYPDYQRGRLYAFRLERRLGSAGSISGKYNRTSEHSTLPVTGNALDSAIAPRVLNQNLAFFLNSPWLPILPHKSKGVSSVTRFSWGRTGMDFSDVRGRSPLASDLFPSQQFLLNAPMIFNTTLPGSAHPTLVSANSPDGALLMNSVQLSGITNTEAITGPLGEVMLGGFSGVGADVFRFPQRRSDHTLQIANTVSMNVGRHAITYGVDARRIRMNNNLNRNALPAAQFNGTYGNILINSGPYELPAVSMAAAGIPTRFLQTLATSPDDSLDLNLTQVDFFVNDAIRISRRFRLDAGFRLGIHGSPDGLSERVNKAFNETDFLAQIAAAEATCHGDCAGRLQYLSGAFPGNYASLFRADRVGNDVRLGFAWDVFGNSRMAVRGGVGSYTGDFPLIVMSESRNIFPAFLPLNMANAPGYGSNTAFGIPTSPYRYLVNLANPLLQAENRQLQDIIQRGTVNLLTPGAAMNPVSLLGFGLNTLYPSLVPTYPATQLKHPYAFQYAFTVEGEIRPDLLLSVGYVGTRGIKLLRITAPDLAFRTRVTSTGAPVPLASAAPFPIVVADLTPNLVDRNQIAGLNQVGIYRNLYESSATSSYHSLQVELRKRYTNRLQVGATFVYSHAIDDSSDFFDTTGEFALPQDSIRRSESGSSAFDTRLRSTGFFVLDLPRVTSGNSAGASHVFRTLFDDWHLSGIWVAQSGQPYTINTSVDVNGDGNPTDRLNSTNGLVFHPSTDRSVQVINTGRANLLAPIGQDGAVGRNVFTGDRLYSLDLALSKAVPFIDEHKRVELRVETFNLLNRPAFGVPDRILESPGFGRSIRTVNQPRTLQFAARLRF
jgi:hypothetical protein